MSRAFVGEHPRSAAQIAREITTLPDDARIIKMIGGEVMVLRSDPAALVDWAVGFQQLHATRPLPRIGMHYGEVLYRAGASAGSRVVTLSARHVTNATNIAAQRTCGRAPRGRRLAWTPPRVAGRQ